MTASTEDSARSGIIAVPDRHRVDVDALAAWLRDRVADFHGPLTLDLFHRDARHGHRWLHLHPREFGVLWRLSDTPGQRVTRRDLLEDVWRLSHDPQTNSVEVHISRLRAKIDDGFESKLIQTVRGMGYVLEESAGA